MSWSTSKLRVRLAPLNQFKPSSNIFYLLFQSGTSFVDHSCYFCHVFVMPLCKSVYCCLVVAAGKELASWLTFEMSNCEFVTFPLVSVVRCGTRLYQFLIFALILTSKYCMPKCHEIIKKNQIVNVIMCNPNWFK